MSKNTQLFTSISQLISIKFKFLCLLVPLLKRALKEKEKIAKEMILFFSHTFGKVTKLDVSRCNLDSDAAEVWLWPVHLSTLYRLMS